LNKKSSNARSTKTAASATGELPLHGQVAVISGGLGDIGRATALALHAAGAAVALSDIHPAAVARERMPEFHYRQVNVTKPLALRRWLADVQREVGLPTLIICNAAIVALDTPLTAAPETWRRTLEVNLSGSFFLAQYAAQDLVAQRQPGRIVFVGSWAGHAPHRHVTSYCVAKAALRMAMECLAIELAPSGIRVNEVAPGKVDAGLSGQFYVRDPRLRQKAKKRVPLGELMQPDDVARGVVYLCDPTNRHMTGAVLLMDGGLSLVRPR
jgi:NAD(P)-dependent dehydrogenase (short-subunit alcohol dehydrogenase family)